MTEQSATFEQQLHRLEEIVQLLERGQLPLEETLKHFEEGVALLRQCRSRLDGAQLRVQQLIDDRGEQRLAPLEHQQTHHNAERDEDSDNSTPSAQEPAAEPNPTIDEHTDDGEFLF